jgi:plasmid maintenance system antidote protein VapI
MDVFSIDFTLNEINFIRQCLELPSILGKDAKFLANLQNKIEQELAEIQRLKEEELKKTIGVEQTK